MSSEIEVLKAEWPDWSIWTTGSLWGATRRGPKSDLGSSDLVQTLIEDSSRELTAALKQQAEILEAIR